MPARVPPQATVLAALVLAGVVGACGPTVSPSPSATATSPSSPSPARTTTPSPTATAPESDDPSGSAPPDDETTYRLIEEAVAPLRELEALDDVDPQLLDEDELKRRTEASFTEDNPPDLIEANEVLYRALGMLDEDESLGNLYVELLGSQVAGFYDPEVDELFVVSRSGGLGVAERITYAHEYTHALQDQHFDLESFGLDEIGEGDRSVARLALIEGDATAVMTFWAQQALTPEEMVDLFTASLDPEALEILNRMPPILRESLMFPYEKGLQLVLGLQLDGGWDAVNAAYDDPPASTEQVIHPEKYEAREVPVDVGLPPDLAERMGAGWEVTYEDTFGEFQAQVWLRNGLGRADEGNEAAAGWGGDRFAVLQGPDDAWAVIMLTTWDSSADAREFASAAGTLVDDGDHPGTVIERSRDVSVVVASDGETLEAAAAAAGSELRR